MIISIDGDKAFYKISCPFMATKQTTTARKLKIEETFSILCKYLKIIPYLKIKYWKISPQEIILFYLFYISLLMFSIIPQVQGTIARQGEEIRIIKRQKDWKEI